MYHVLKYQGSQNFKPRYVLTIKCIAKSMETFKLLLSSNYIPIYHPIKFNYYKYFVKLFAKQPQQNLNFWILRSLSKI